MASEFLLGPTTPAQLARSGGYSFLDFKLLVGVIGEPGGVLGVLSRHYHSLGRYLSARIQTMVA
jgi:hypothetical protein